MTWDEDLDALEAFRDGLPDFFEVEDIAAVDPSAEVVDRALRALTAAFTEVPPPRYDDRADALIQLAAMILAAEGGYGEHVFDHVALQVSHVAAHKELAPLLRLISGDGLAPLLLRALRADDDTARMALSLGLWSYHGQLPSPLTEAEARAIEDAVAALRSRAKPDSPLAHALAAWIPVRPR